MDKSGSSTFVGSVDRPNKDSEKDVINSSKVNSSDVPRALLLRSFSSIAGTEQDRFLSTQEKDISHGLKTFSLLTYNILADCHAQRDYSKPGSWITKEELSMSNRHKLLMEEFRWLNADIVCLQEVGSEYFKTILEPCLKEIGYDGLYIARHCHDYEEGEATFYKFSKFILKCSKGLVLKDVIGKEISDCFVDGELKKSLLESVDSYAVSLLTRLENKEFGFAISIANVHIAYDKLERQDKQCLQVAATIRELQQFSEADDGQIICGDFNSWPLSPPQELINKGNLSEENINLLRSILTIHHLDATQCTPLFNYVPELFSISPAPKYKSAYQAITGSDPYSSRFNFDGKVRQVDFIYFSSALSVQKVLTVPDKSIIEKGVPNSQFPSDHLSLMAEFHYI